MPRKHIVITGRVQGVGFRYHANLLAQANSLTGWVSNMDSGDVVMELQGHAHQIDQFLNQLGKNSMFIRIDHMEIEDRDEIRESGFRIRY